MMGWLGDDKNWFLPAQKKIPTKPETAKKEPENEYAVFYIPIRCPNKKCGSKDIKCYTSSPPTRYHICRECGLRFKSIEQ